MPPCNVVHPEHPQFVCSLKPGMHPDHVAIVIDPATLSREQTSWPNEDYRSAEMMRQQSAQTHAKVTQFAQATRAANLAPKEVKPIRAKSKLGNVASFLIANVGQWIPGNRFVDPRDVDGGAQGLKRIRELRVDHGWAIEERPDPDPNTFVHQYRLVELPPDY